MISLLLLRRHRFEYFNDFLEKGLNATVQDDQQAVCFLGERVAVVVGIEHRSVLVDDADALLAFEGRTQTLLRAF